MQRPALRALALPPQLAAVEQAAMTTDDDNSDSRSERSIAVSLDWLRGVVMFCGPAAQVRQAVSSVMDVLSVDRGLWRSVTAQNCP